MIAHIWLTHAEEEDDDDNNNVKWYFNLLTGSFLGCWCNMPSVFNCPLLLVPIKQEKGCKHSGVCFQCLMKNLCKDEIQLLFTIIAIFMFFFYLFGRLENTALHIWPSTVSFK
jgi:hypothetical protein